MKRANRRSKQSSPIDDASASAEKEKQMYEERIRELERENKAYQMEIAELKQKQGNYSAATNGVEKLKKHYLQKLNLLEEQVTELQSKLASRSQFSTQRKRVDESSRQFQFEIQSLKAQKVQLQCKMKLDSVQFRICKAMLEKEILQLKKERRTYDIKVQNLLASNDRLKMVLQRKTEAAFTATNRLREMIEARKVISNRSAGARKRNSEAIHAAEHELEVTTRLHKLCSQYESRIEKMAAEIGRLKEEIEMQRNENLRSEFQVEETDSFEKEVDIQDLKEQMNGLGCLLRELKLQKEMLDSKDKKQQVLDQPLFTDESNRKLLMKMETPETNSSSDSNANGERTDEGVCCTCSKRSLCKTTKCKCRSIGGSCGPSCGCKLFKCTNRESNQIEEETEAIISESTECNMKMNNSAVFEHGNIIASECAKLLQSALVQKPASYRDNPGPIKKPLSDIQNSLGQLDNQKQGKKKTVRKPIIQLVTNNPMSTSPENISSSSTEQSNSIQSNELATSVGDAPVARPSRNPPRHAKSVVGKENYLT
ncbi:kinesin-like protein KIN-4C isoform X1 [Arachis stenosperma]|uniref:kinesin-like protein KIN-4C isoform X1 n=1 Tax=Arachis stenosperma TaxID=217475 RepID=UPI0025AC6F63|nr:kinesin-like protein KIN-4C isoform X1 [Arachis stenosperma]